MEYNPSEHSMKCPKCEHGMEESTYGGDLTVDRCTQCQGIWFDSGEEQVLKAKWMGEALDMSDPEVGKKWNKVEDIACPRCGKQMQKGADSKQSHLWFEFCADHGMFMDAGEFTDFKNETVLDWFRGLTRGKR